MAGLCEGGNEPQGSLKAIYWNPQGARYVGRPRGTRRRTTVCNEAKSVVKSWSDCCRESYLVEDSYRCPIPLNGTTG
ncbi:hypothetical protein ANN_04195 [Periplaneta americana]|uniref:Uncharacterized protein n=1 Tax=Periplaneta americana TaxID=6978 RepID=A0ABQ8T9E1_PERAM|nr:hypothetical protein ANN_04195 [Periplaneta americana]